MPRNTWWRTLGQFALEIFYPDFCCHCGRGATLLCDDCHEVLEFIGDAVTLSLPKVHLDSGVAAVQFTPVSRSVVHTLKYEGIPGVAAVCGHLMYQSLVVPPTAVVSWVPLHSHRFRLRGFNQAEAIARVLARDLRRPAVPLLCKTKATDHQAGLRSRTDRTHHNDDTFALLPSLRAPPPGPTHPLGARSALPTSVLLIDDVITTGATLNECARVLKEAGVITVHAATFAHGV